MRPQLLAILNSANVIGQASRTQRTQAWKYASASFWTLGINSVCAEKYINMLVLPLCSAAIAKVFILTPLSGSSRWIRSASSLFFASPRLFVRAESWIGTLPREVCRQTSSNASPTFDHRASDQLRNISRVSRLPRHQ